MNPTLENKTNEATEKLTAAIHELIKIISRRAAKKVVEDLQGLHF